MIEKHFTLTPGAGGDHDFAATGYDIRSYLSFPNWANLSRYDGSPDLAPSEAETEARTYARRSIVIIKDMYDLAPLTRDCVDFLRPGTGIPPSRWHELDGRPVHAVKAGTMLNEELLV